MRQGFGGWSPGLVRFRPELGETDQRKHIVASFVVIFFGSEHLVDKCCVLAGRKFYVSLVSRSDLEKESDSGRIQTI